MIVHIFNSGRENNVPYSCIILQQNEHNNHFTIQHKNGEIARLCEISERRSTT
jgi:hypothetical protein